MKTYYSATDDISFTPLTVEEEKQLFARFYASKADNMSQDSIEARNEIMARHLKLVAKISLQTAKNAMDEDEAISAGNFGLLTALNARSFDPNYGVQFCQYVRQYIRGEVLKTLRERGNWRVVKGEEGREVCAPEAVVTGRYGAETATDCTHGGFAVVSYPTARCRRVIQTVEHAAEECQLSEERKKAIEEGLKNLPEWEAKLIRLHFFQHLNHADLARRFGMTREGIRKAFNRGMRKLEPFLASMKDELL